MMRIIRDGVIFIGLVLSVALIGCEALIRLLDRTKPELSVNLIKPEEVDMTFNAEGFRDRDFSKTKAPNVFRILILGNSVTFGVSVAIQQTYVKQFEEMLNASKSKTTFEVMNAGGPWNTLYQEKYLESKGIEYNPDLVIIGFTLNSAEGYYIPPADVFTADETKYRDDPEVRPRNPRDLLEPILKFQKNNPTMQTVQLRRIWEYPLLKLSIHSALYRYMRWRYDLLKQPFDKDYPHSLYYAEAHAHWDLCRESLRSMERFTAARKVPIVLIIFPLFVKLKPGPNPGDGYPWEPIHDLIAAAGQDIGMPVLDMLPVFRGWDPRDISVDPYHMNPLGHLMAARAIYSALTKDGIIPQQ